METECKGVKSKFTLGKATFFKIPLDCDIKAKNFEICTKKEYETTKDQFFAESIQQFEYKIIMNASHASHEINVGNMSRSDDKTKFDTNINQTTDALGRIVVGHEGIFDELRIVKIGGFSTSAVLTLTMMGILLYCIRRKCKNRNEGKNVNVNINLKPDDIEGGKDDTHSNIELENANEANKQDTDEHTSANEMINKQFSRKKL
jgi:hypothetical protein